MAEFTKICQVADGEDPQAAHEVFEAVYSELRRLAASKMALENAGQTLQPTALVHEAWLRLGGENQPMWRNRAHFFSAAAEAMRRILIDRARRRKAARRGGGWERAEVPLEHIPLANDPDQMLALDEALQELALEEPMRAEVVKLHCFVGMTHAEIAEALQVSEKTVSRYWAYSIAWLQRFMEQKK